MKGWSLCDLTERKEGMALSQVSQRLMVFTDLLLYLFQILVVIILQTYFWSGIPPTALG